MFWIFKHLDEVSVSPDRVTIIQQSPFLFSFSSGLHFFNLLLVHRPSSSSTVHRTSTADYVLLCIPAELSICMHTFVCTICMHSKPTFSAVDPLFRAHSEFDLQNAMSLPGLGLPGLGLEEPSEQAQTVEAVQHDLAAGSEWRFEVAFGKFVKVRVRNLSGP